MRMRTCHVGKGSKAEGLNQGKKSCQIAQTWPWVKTKVHEHWTASYAGIQPSLIPWNYETAEAGRPSLRGCPSGRERKTRNGIWGETCHKEPVASGA